MEDKEFLCPGIINGVGIVKITEKESNTPHFDIIRDDGSKVSIMIQDTNFPALAFLVLKELVSFGINRPILLIQGMGLFWVCELFILVDFVKMAASLTHDH